MNRSSLTRIAAMLLAFLSLAGPASAAAQLGADPPGAAATFDQRYERLRRLDEGAVAVADVGSIVLTRDAGTFRLEGGRLYRLRPFGDRTVALVYAGEGTFAFQPTDATEQRQVAKVHRVSPLSARLREVVFIFSDSTLAQLGRGATFRDIPALPGDLRRRVREAFDYLSDRRSKSPDPDVMADLLNASTSDLFYAHIGRTEGEPVMFMVDPYEVESVRLLGRARKVGWARVTDVVSQGRPRGDTAPVETERRAQAEVTRYTLDVAMPRTASGEINFSAAARLDITARQAVGPWVAFALYPKLVVDSARWADGTPALVHKRKDAAVMWLRADRALAANESRSVTVYYHGDLIERYSELFFIRSSIAWYPVSLEGRTKAVFDMTFTTPQSYAFVSVGDRIDSAGVGGRMVRTRWVTPSPIRNASFNLGRFEERRFDAADLPGVSVLHSEEAHRAMHLKAFASEQVGTDVQNALRFFERVYGELAVGRLYATEIPYAHGEAFPGLIHLAMTTFLETDVNGFDEFFRAHEVAHQWWGIGVDYATYHDRWLSEGLASFSGLWYLQTVREDTRYADMLDRWKADIVLRRRGGEPVSLGHRVAEAGDESDYRALVYHKGAWVAHMLRILMMDLETLNEDRFIAAMREFYATCRGGRASTEDLRRVAEKHAGADLRWFFDQWVHSSEMPTYRVAWRSEPAEGGTFRVRLRVAQENVPHDFQMFVPVSVDLGGGSVARIRVRITGPVTELELPLVPAKPKSLTFNDLSGVLAEVKMVGW